MSDTTVHTSASRKDDHVRLATEQANSRHSHNDFDDVRFVHHAIRARDFADVTTQTSVFGSTWKSPLYINAMTGGSDSTGQINAGLARVAHATGIAIASGSMSHLVKDPSSVDTYRVLRSLNPDGFVFANVSANATPEEAKQVIDAVEADALQIHINSVQEVVMPEGDRKFSHWPDHIYAMTEALNLPVVVKEVGFGMSEETVSDLAQLGVEAVDVSGRGGTNFAAIENDRREGRTFTDFDDWGQSTVSSLLDVTQAAQKNHMAVFASGGVRNPLDAAKALALGAHAVGVAGGFLHVLQREGEEALITHINNWNERLQSLQSALNARNPQALREASVLISGSPSDFAKLRGINLAQYAKRSPLLHRRENV